MTITAATDWHLHNMKCRENKFFQRKNFEISVDIMLCFSFYFRKQTEDLNVSGMTAGAWK